MLKIFMTCLGTLTGRYPVPSVILYSMRLAAWTEAAAPLCAKFSAAEIVFELGDLLTASGGAK